MRNEVLILIFLLILNWGCLGKQNKSDDKFLSENRDWTTRFDFDGDGVVDPVKYSHTGGANCCYKISVFLSANKETVLIPADIKGGYIFFDLSQPEQFDIKDIDKDKLPEIIIGIDSLNKLVFEIEKGKLVKKVLTVK